MRGSDLARCCPPAKGTYQRTPGSLVNWGDRLSMAEAGDRPGHVRKKSSFAPPVYWCPVAWLTRRFWLHSCIESHSQMIMAGYSNIAVIDFASPYFHSPSPSRKRAMARVTARKLGTVFINSVIDVKSPEKIYWIGLLPSPPLVLVVGGKIGLRKEVSLSGKCRIRWPPLLNIRWHELVVVILKWELLPK